MPAKILNFFAFSLACYPSDIFALIPPSFFFKAYLLAFNSTKNSLAVGVKAPATTGAAPNLETTAEGSSQGSEETGDAGIALAATICVAASAAFVLTRKKKETV